MKDKINNLIKEYKSTVDHYTTWIKVYKSCNDFPSAVEAHVRIKQLNRTIKDLENILSETDDFKIEKK